MAKPILPYTTQNTLSDLIRQRSEKTGKCIGDIEVDLAKYCNISVMINNRGEEAAGTIKKIKAGAYNPRLEVALKICEYFGVTVDNVFKLKEE